MLNNLRASLHDVAGDAARFCDQPKQDPRIRSGAGSRNRIQLTDGAQQLRTQV